MNRAGGVGVASVLVVTNSIFDCFQQLIIHHTLVIAPNTQHNTNEYLALAAMNLGPPALPMPFAFRIHYGKPFLCCR